MVGTESLFSLSQMFCTNTAGHLASRKRRQRPKARTARHGGVHAQLAVRAAERIVVDDGAAVHEHPPLKLGIGVDHSACQHHATGTELS